MSLYHRVAPLHIYGPSNLGPVIKFYLSYFGSDIGYEIVFHPLVRLGKSASSALLCNPVRENAPETDVPNLPSSSESTLELELPGKLREIVRVTAFPLNHKIDCYGYRFDEVVAPRRNPWKPRSYAYVSDTAPFPELAGYVQGVDILYHEATYPVGMEDKAAQYYHSTSVQAAACAREAGVGRLLIGHYSSRVKDIRTLADECREVFPQSFTVEDGDVFEIEYIRES